MEAIKNLRESSVLLSNTWCSSYAELAMGLWSPVANIVLDGLKYNGTNGNIDEIKHTVDRCAEGCIADHLADIVKAHATDVEYRALFDGLVAFENHQYDTFVDAEERGEIGYDVPGEEQKCELSATMSNNDGRSEEEKEDDILFEAEMDDAFSPSEGKEEERVLTPEEEEAAFDAMFQAQFGNCQCFGAPRTMVIGTSYNRLAEAIYNFCDAQVMVCKKPSDNLDIEFVKEVILGMASIGHTRIIADELRKEAIDADYRGIYRELYILLQNDIADIDEDIYLHDDVPYSIEMCDGYRVVCPHFEQTIEADEVNEDAFIDDDFDLILNEETGKVEMCRDHTPRLTDEDYEEMERLEADDNFHASLYEADCLPF